MPLKGKKTKTTTTTKKPPTAFFIGPANKVEGQ